MLAPSEQHVPLRLVGVGWSARRVGPYDQVEVFRQAEPVIVTRISSSSTRITSITRGNLRLRFFSGIANIKHMWNRDVSHKALRLQVEVMATRGGEEREAMSASVRGEECECESSQLPLPFLTLASRSTSWYEIQKPSSPKVALFLSSRSLATHSDTGTERMKLSVRLKTLA